MKNSPEGSSLSGLEQLNRMQDADGQGPAMTEEEGEDLMKHLNAEIAKQDEEDKGKLEQLRKENEEFDKLNSLIDETAPESAIKY